MKWAYSYVFVSVRALRRWGAINNLLLRSLTSIREKATSTKERVCKPSKKIALMAYRAQLTMDCLFQSHLRRCENSCWCTKYPPAYNHTDVPGETGSRRGGGASGNPWTVFFSHGQFSACKIQCWIKGASLLGTWFVQTGRSWNSFYSISSTCLGSNQRFCLKTVPWF